MKRQKQKLKVWKLNVVVGGTDVLLVETHKKWLLLLWVTLALWVGGPKGTDVPPPPNGNTKAVTNL